MKIEKTEWFPPEVKPAFVGCYEIYSPGLFALWDGEKWLACHTSFKKASGETKPSVHADEQWRGMKTDQSHILAFDAFSIA